MICIAPPSFKVSDIYDTCIDNYRDRKLFTNLLACKGLIINQESEYFTKAESKLLYTIDQILQLSKEIEKSHMVDLYDFKFVQDKGRPFYKRILESSPGNKCPYCGERYVETVDHFLPKAKYPIFSITPINLIPSCYQCNKVKDQGINVYDKANLVLHPYFECISKIQWLIASLTEQNHGAIEYSIDTTHIHDSDIRARITHQFTKLNLNSLYRNVASTELAGSLCYFKEEFEMGGESQLKRYLLRQYNSWSINNINSCVAVMYKTLSENDWFCSGNFINSELQKKCENP